MQVSEIVSAAHTTWPSAQAPTPQDWPLASPWVPFMSVYFTLPVGTKSSSTAPSQSLSVLSHTSALASPMVVHVSDALSSAQTTSPPSQAPTPQL